MVILVCVLLVLTACATGRASAPPPRSQGGGAYPVGGGCGVGAPVDDVNDAGVSVAGVAL